MNQYDSLISDYFYEFKSLSFEKIGVLSLSEKNFNPDYPAAPGSIQFKFDKKAATTPELADYIAAKTGKNKVLIHSDLESYVELMRQFVNIGKATDIEGIGTFRLAKSGEYVFAALDTSGKKEESKSSRKQKPLPDSPLSVKKSSNKNFLMLLALLIVLGVLGILGWGGYKLFTASTAAPNTTTDTATANTPVPQPAADTATVKKDSISGGDSSAAYYKFIHERTNLESRAYSRTSALKSYGYPAFLDSVKQDTSTLYTLYFRYRLRASDTAFVRDSLSKLLNKKITIKPGA